MWVFDPGVPINGHNIIFRVKTYKIRFTDLKLTNFRILHLDYDE